MLILACIVCISLYFCKIHEVHANYPLKYVANTNSLTLFLLACPYGIAKQKFRF